MKRDEWDRLEKSLNHPDVALAMRGRCEEQGHDFEFCMSAMFDRWEQCKWCGERKNFRNGIV